MKKMNKKTLIGLIVTFLALAASIFVLISAGVIQMPEQKQEAAPAEVIVEEDESQSHSHQDSMVLAQRQKYRSMEQNRKPRDKSTHLWTPYLRQRRGEYTME